MTPWDEMKESVGYAGRIILWLILALAIVSILFGCTQFGNDRTQKGNGPFTGVCALRPIGEQGGITYVQYHCEPN